MTYGKEWEKELMKKPKSFLIRFLKNTLEANSGLQREKEILLEACKTAYKKYYLPEESIGWGEFSGILVNALYEVMEDDEFIKLTEEE